MTSADIELAFALIGVVTVIVLSALGLFSIIAMLMYAYGESDKEPHD